MALRYALRSDVGRTRERNEDCAAARPAQGLFAIADGMGGHAGGEIASRVALDAVLEALAHEPAPGLDALGRALQHANRRVLEEAARRRLWGMGTTLTLARVGAGQLRIAHVGDSRAYLVHAGRGEQLTRDQTLVELLVQQGTLAREQARHHPERHVLAQALGTEARLQPELLQRELPPGSRLLLSTDGVHDQIPEPELIALAAGSDLDAAAEALVAAADRAGGLDNATVILVET